MSQPEELSGQTVYQAMLPARLTDGIVVRRITKLGDPVIASNVPPLRHASRTGFDFGIDNSGAVDLALACVNAILERMDYAGPTLKVWDGSRVYTLAQELQVPFLNHFIVPASSDELRIPWNQALGWVRRMLLQRVQDKRLNSDDLIETWRRSVSSLPDALPETELDRADLTRHLRKELVEMMGDASILAQFLGMIG